jgi:hypothetical protein
MNRLSGLYTHTQDAAPDTNLQQSSATIDVKAADSAAGGPSREVSSLT